MADDDPSPCLSVAVDHEEDGRFIAEVTEVHGALAYWKTRAEPVAKVEALALRVMADRLESDAAIPKSLRIFAVAA